MSDGKTPPYFNWANEEPNNKDGNQNCVTIGIHGSEKWDDDECTDTWPFVCEIDWF